MIRKLRSFGPIIKRASLMLVMAVFACSMASQAASALSPAQKMLFQENINYFNVDACSTASSTQTDSTGNNKVYVIGDSLTVGMRDAGNLKAKLTNAGWGVTDIEATTNINITDSIPKIKADSGKNVSQAGTVVVGLGTNPAGGGSKQEVESMLGAINITSPNARIIWINAYATNIDYSNFNAVLNDHVGQGNGKIAEVLDWAQEAKSNAGAYDLASGGGIHTTAAGYIKRSDWLVHGLGGVPSAGGSGKPSGAVFPNLNEGAMASAIDKWISQNNPSSKLGGLGATIVASAKNSNVSPFLIVAIAKEESNLADPSDFNVGHGSNAFGREATSSQPHFQGANTWYKWSSVKASVDYTAPENNNASGGGDMASYLKDRYGSQIQNSDLVSLFLQYAPPAENNTAQYTKNVRSWISDMVSLAGTSPSDTASTQSATDLSCCPPGSESSTQLKGGTNAERVWNYFIGQPGMNNTLVAAIMGNIAIESCNTFDPTIVFGCGHTSTPGSTPWGLVQWLPGSKVLGIQQQAGVSGDIADLPTQLQVIWWEASTNHSPSSGWDFKTFKAFNDVAQATTYWEDHFEGATGQADQARINAAHTWINRANGGSLPSTPGSTTPSPSGSGCGSTASASTTAGFTNPFPKGWVPGRLDMGYDGTFTGQIVAPFSGTITYATKSFSNWGGYIEIKADKQLSGLPTSTLYFAEGVAPAAGISANPGKPVHVDAGTPIADAFTTGAQAGVPGNIEFGLAQDGPVGQPSDTYTKVPGNGSQAAVQSVLDFAKWVEQVLGVAPPSSTDNAGSP